MLEVVSRSAHVHEITTPNGEVVATFTGWEAAHAMLPHFEHNVRVCRLCGGSSRTDPIRFHVWDPAVPAGDYHDECAGIRRAFSFATGQAPRRLVVCPEQAGYRLERLRLGL